MSLLNVHFYKTFRNSFSKKISKACTLSRETIVLQVENEMCQIL